MTKTKTFDAYVYINWKDENLRLRKTKQNDPSPYEIVTELSIDVEVPEVNIPEISKTIQVSETKVKEAVQEIVDFDKFEDSEMPDPNLVLMQPYDGIVHGFNDLEIEGVEEEHVNWLRSVVSYEYTHSQRDDVIEFLETTLHEWKQEADS